MILLIFPASLYSYCLLQNSAPSQLNVEIGFVFLMLYGSTNAFLTLIFVGPYRLQAYKHLVVPFLNFLDVMGIKNKIFTQNGLTSEQTSGRHATT